MADEQKQTMNVGEFLFLAKEVHASPAAVLSAPLVLFDEEAGRGEAQPFVVVTSTEPVAKRFVDVLPPGTLVLRIARYEPPRLVVEAP